MASQSTSQNVVLTAPAPIIGNTATEHEFTDIIIVNMGMKTKLEFSYAEALGALLEGCGVVDLVSLHVTAFTSAAKDYFAYGITEVGGSQSISSLVGKTNGFKFTANTFNAGCQTVRELVPEDTLSRRIKPPPADMPVAKILVEKNDVTELVFTFKIKVHGMRTRYASF